METSFYRYLEINSGKNPFKKLLQYFDPINLTTGATGALIMRTITSYCKETSRICYYSSNLSQTVIISIAIYLTSLGYFYVMSRKNLYDYTNLIKKPI